MARKIHGIFLNKNFVSINSMQFMTVCNTWRALNAIHGEKLPDREFFYSSVKDGTTGDNYKKLDGHISDEDYLTCKKI